MKRARLLSLGMIALGLLGSFSASTAHASVTDTTNQSGFVSALQPGYYLETFDSLPHFGFTSPQTFTSGAFSYTAATPFNFFNSQIGASGTYNNYLSTSRSYEAITLTFSGSNVYAVGGYFFIADSTAKARGSKFEIQINGGPAIPYSTSSVNDFIGFTSTTPITSLVMRPTGTDPSARSMDYATINNLYVGAAVVPEPASLTLIALAALPLISRRRK